MKKLIYQNQIGINARHVLQIIIVYTYYATLTTQQTVKKK